MQCFVRMQFCKLEFTLELPSRFCDIKTLEDSAAHTETSASWTTKRATINKNMQKQCFATSCASVSNAVERLVGVTLIG